MPTPCMEFLSNKKPESLVRGVLVVFGDDDFLRRQAIMRLRELTVGVDADDFALSTHPGDKAVLADVLDELFTPPFIGDQRLVIVEDADKFITANRESLQKYAMAPSESGILLLEARSWTATTKLAKQVEATGLAIESNAPKPYLVPNWVVAWTAARIGKKISKQTADWLVELVGPTLGQLDQELQKLATHVGDRPEIDIAAVNALVAGTRVESTFKLLELLFEGRLPQALEFLDRQLVAGDPPVMILAALTSQLRKLTLASRMVDKSRSLDAALQAAGIPPFAIKKSAAQLNHLGRQRMMSMYRRLLAADLDLKGGTTLDPRILLERFLVRLAKAAPMVRK